MLPLPRRVYAWIAPLWILCLIVGSLMPYETKVAMGSRPGYPVNPKLKVVTMKHRSFHWLSFGATALLLMLLARTRSQDVAMAAATIALGCAIEFAQAFIYRGRIEWWDMRDDTYAVLVVLLVVQFAAIKRFLVRDSKVPAPLVHELE